MNFDITVLRSILNARAERKQNTELLAQQRREEVYEKIPRIRDIDIELRKTPIEIVRATFTDKEKAEKALYSVREKNLALQKERAELLQKAGLRVDFMEPSYRCKICEDSGYVSAGVPCDCLVEEYKNTLRRQLANKLSISESGFDSIKLDVYPSGGANSVRDLMQSNLDLCKGFVKNFAEEKENLFLTGKTGKGKSLFASCIALEVGCMGFDVVFESAFDIFQKLEDRRFSRLENADTTEKYKTCDLLVIDDLGTELITAFSIASLYNIMTSRANSGKKTIIVSSLDANEIETKYNPQIASRLRGEYIEVPFAGADIRGIKGK